MNKRSRKTKGLSRRLIAWLLCCVCLAASMPMSAIAEEDEALVLEETALVEETTLVEPTEEASVVPEETAAPPAETEPLDSEDTTVDTGDVETEKPTEPTDKVEMETSPVVENTEAPTESEEESASASVETAAATETERSKADALYERLMACTTYEELEAALDALTDEELSLMDNFTDAQNAALEAKMDELGGYGVQTLENRTCTIMQGESQKINVSYLTNDGFNYKVGNDEPVSGITVSKNTGWLEEKGYTINVDLDVPVGDYTLTVNYQTKKRSKTESHTDHINLTVTKFDNPEYTFTVTPTLTNVDVVYYAYHDINDVAKGISFTSVTNGTPVSVENFSYKKSGYILFFVKPDANYLLTNAKGSGNNDVYSVDENLGNIRNYPEIATIVAQAKQAGYIGVLGYSRGKGDTNGMSQSINLAGKSPDITVTAISSKTENVKPDDQLTFTVTITPGKLEGSSAEVKEVNVESLQVNGKDVKYTDLKKNEDGTYTTTVTYQATVEDCNNGSVELNVTANVKYSNLLGVSNEQSLASTATIEKSAKATCLIAPKSDVTYRLSYVNADGIAENKYPDVIKTKPANVNGLYKGDSMEVASDFYASRTVDDPTNRGTWEFTGWFYNEEIVTSVTMGEEPICLDGKWTFTPYPNAELTIKKTVSGNMQDANKEFTFIITSDKAIIDGDDSCNTITFKLKKDQEKKISVPVGAVITVSEEAADYTYSIGSGTTITDYKELTSGNGIQFTMPNDNSTVVFNNAKNITVDTGVILDTLPYILILIIVVIGVVVLIKRRRNRDDD